MKKNDLKKAWPVIAAIVLFVVITMVYFNPLIQGKQLKQGDITNFQGMSKEIVDYRNATGEEALWTNSMFGGMPAYQISVVHKSNLINFFDKAIKLWLPHPAGMVFLYFLGFYILLLVLGVDKRLGIVGAIAFALSSYFFIILEAGHNSKANAIGYMAPAIAGIILCFRGKYIVGGVVTALFLALEINANHLQITYYLMLFVLILGIVEFVEKIKEKQLKSFFKSIVVMFVALIIALGANVSNLWTTYEYGKYSTRGKSELTNDKANKTSGLDKDYATDWSYGVPETFSLLIPNVQGGASGYINDNKTALKDVDENYKEAVSGMNQYWGEQPFTSGPVYAGAIVVFLFVLGALIVKGKMKWTLVIATIVSIMLAWGRHFMPLTEFFLDYIPGYNKFRAVSMILVIAELTIPLLAILALKEIFDRPEILKEKKKQFYIAFGLTGGLALLFWLTPSTFFSFITDSENVAITRQMNNYLAQSPENTGQIREYFDNIIPNLETARIAIFKADAIRSFLFILVGAVTIFAFSRKKMGRFVFILTIAALITADMFVVNKRYLNDKNFVSKSRAKVPYHATAADEIILQDKDLNYRVMNLTVSTFNDASTSYFHKSIGGYHGAKLKRYQELIEFQISKNNMKVLNMLNTRYFIVADSTGAPAVQKNPDALGNAWFVDNAKLVVNADSEIAALTSFDPAVTAVVDKRFESTIKNKIPGKDTTAVIKLTEYKPNFLKYSYTASKPQMAVFSEIYYDKGWNAYIDGKEMPYFRADYVLRAMEVPSGTHEITWKFEPNTFYTGEKISLAFNILLILGIAGGVFVEIKNRNKKALAKNGSL